MAVMSAEGVSSRRARVRISGLLFSGLLLGVATTSSADQATGRLMHRLMSDISAHDVETTIRELAGFGTRHSLSEQNDPARGIGAARRYIQARLERCSDESGGRLQVSLDAFVAQPGPNVPSLTPMTNVVATLPGSEPASRSRHYVIGAHYDSRASKILDAGSDAPGANDDASGVAVVIAAACALSRHELDATLVFLATAGEEQALLGARHWVAEARQRRIDVAGMITNDIVGGSREGRASAPRVLRLFAEGVPERRDPDERTQTLLRSGGENDGAARQLARFIQHAAQRYVPGMAVQLIYRRDRYLRTGDHVPFLEAGYPAVRFTEGVESFRHQHQNVRNEGDIQYGDLPEFIDFAYASQAARINAVALAALALGPAPPREVTIEAARLENDTTLQWRANQEPDLAGYRILWRETTSAFWQHELDVGITTRHTLRGISKDNWLFGVQALDRSGNSSVATFPRPVR